MPDAATRKSAALTETLQSQGGICPYFPLTRKGKYRLAHSTRPSKPRQRDRREVLEYPTLRKAQQEDKVAELGGSDSEISEASSQWTYKEPHLRNLYKTY